MLSLAAALAETRSCANGATRMPARSLAGDQSRQLERLDEADLADLPRRCLGHEQVFVLECSLEDAALRAWPCEVDAPPPGPADGLASLELRRESA
jgi:hypothetical protein